MVNSAAYYFWQLVGNLETYSVYLFNLKKANSFYNKLSSLDMNDPVFDPNNSFNLLDGKNLCANIDYEELTPIVPVLQKIVRKFSSIRKIKR